MHNSTIAYCHSFKCPLASLLFSSPPGQYISLSLPALYCLNAPFQISICQKEAVSSISFTNTNPLHLLYIYFISCWGVGEDVQGRVMLVLHLNKKKNNVNQDMHLNEPECHYHCKPWPFLSLPHTHAYVHFFPPTLSPVWNKIFCSSELDGFFYMFCKMLCTSITEQAKNKSNSCSDTSMELA